MNCWVASVMLHSGQLRVMCGPHVTAGAAASWSRVTVHVPSCAAPVVAEISLQIKRAASRITGISCKGQHIGPGQTIAAFVTAAELISPERTAQDKAVMQEAA